jgi:hypothetical protein
VRARSIIVSALLGTSLLAGPALARQALRAGLWEVKVDVADTGSGMKLPSSSQKECLSQAQVDADPVPELEQGSCRATHIRRSGDKVTWDLDCAGVGKGHGEVTYTSPTSYDGWMTLELVGTTVRATIQARRVGDC